MHKRLQAPTLRFRIVLSASCFPTRLSFKAVCIGGLMKHLLLARTANQQCRPSATPQTLGLGALCCPVTDQRVGSSKTPCQNYRCCGRFVAHTTASTMLKPLGGAAVTRNQSILTPSMFLPCAVPPQPTRVASMHHYLLKNPLAQSCQCECDHLLIWRV